MSHRATNERELINWATTEEVLPVARLFGEVQRSKDGITLETSLKLDKASHPDPSDDAGVVHSEADGRDAEPLKFRPPTK